MTAAASPPAPMEDLCCSGCGEPVHEWGQGVCPRCGRPTILRGGGLADFLGGDGATAEAVLAWPDAFVTHADSWFDELPSGPVPAGSFAAELRAHRLAAGDPPRWTPLGRMVAYQWREYRLQAEDRRLAAWFDRMGIGPTSRVLDVGCGAGQTLRLLGPRGPAERVGLDISLDSLAFGLRTAATRGDGIRFVRASAHAMPFPDGRFSHLICRVGLNYMHQARAVSEMARVLQPGGRLYLRVEGLGFDLRLLAADRKWRTRLGRLHDLAAGLALAAVGWQPMPGGRLRVGRVFGTAGRLARALRKGGCGVVRAEPVALQWRIPTGVEILADRGKGPEIRPRDDSPGAHQTGVAGVRRPELT